MQSALLGLRLSASEASMQCTLKRVGCITNTSATPAHHYPAPIATTCNAGSCSHALSMPLLLLLLLPQYAAATVAAACAAQQPAGHTQSHVHAHLRLTYLSCLSLLLLLMLMLLLMLPQYAAGALAAACVAQQPAGRAAAGR